MKDSQRGWELLLTKYRPPPDDFFKSKVICTSNIIIDDHLVFSIYILTLLHFFLYNFKTFIRYFIRSVLNMPVAVLLVMVTVLSSKNRSMNVWLISTDRIILHYFIDCVFFKTNIVHELRFISNHCVSCTVLITIRAFISRIGHLF